MWDFNTMISNEETQIYLTSPFWWCNLHKYFSPVEFGIKVYFKSVFKANCVTKGKAWLPP